MSAFKKGVRRQKVRYRIRKKIQGTAERPRLSVFRSNKYIYCQLIDDSKGVSLTFASTKEGNITTQGLNKVDQSKLVGKIVAEKALAMGISKVVFDRGGYLYHGRVKALADGAREAGLQF